MKTEESLQYIGLSKAEAKTYESLLMLGEASISDISRATKLERTYCYKVLSKLEMMGICTQTSKSPSHWVAEDPQVLERISNTHHQQLLSTARELGKLARGGQSTQIKLIESVEELRGAYSKLLEKTTRADSIYNPEMLEAHLPGVSSVYINLLEVNHIHSRDLIAGNLTSTSDIFKGMSSVTPRRNEVRYLKNQEQLTTELTITDTDALLIGYTPRPHGVLISNSALTGLLRGLFEVMWGNSEG